MDVKFFEALFLIDGLPEVFKQRVNHLWGRAMDIFHENIGGGLKVVLLEPLFYGISRVLSPAFMYLHAIEQDFAPSDVLGTLKDEWGLVGHSEERYIIDEKDEDTGHQIVA